MKDLTIYAFSQHPAEQKWIFQSLCKWSTLIVLLSVTVCQVIGVDLRSLSNGYSVLLLHHSVFILYVAKIGIYKNHHNFNHEHFIRKHSGCSRIFIGRCYKTFIHPQEGAIRMINEFEVRMVKFRQSTGADLDTEVSSHWVVVLMLCIDFRWLMEGLCSYTQKTGTFWCRAFPDCM